tara:strand:+ start:1232 stop:1615 length:384 start_codon:yes stop_codon:yes gene_type:complete
MTGFEGMLRDFGITAEDLNDITNHGEVIEFNSSLYQKQESSIQGIGVFAKKDIAKRCVIGIGTIDNTYKTTLGRYTNHSDLNNAKFYYLENNDLIMVAEENILQGSEILINYRHHVNERDSWISNKA